MAIVGTFETLDEAKKLTQDILMQGVIETFVNHGDLLAMLPASQLDSPSHIYNVERQWEPSTGGSMFDIGDQLTFTADEGYERITMSMKRATRSQRLDNFVASNYNNINDYTAQMLMSLTKKLSNYVEYALLYHNSDENNLFIDGLHAQMFRNENIRGTGDQNGLNVDVNGPLSIKHLRDLIDAVDIRSTMITPFFLVPKVIMSRIAAAYQEVGFARTNFNYMSQVTIGARDLGMPIMTFDGIPLISTSRLKKEKANTGTTSGIRELDSSSAGVYSIFLITPGMVGSTNGVQLFFGSRNTGSGGGASAWTTNGGGAGATGIVLIRYAVA